MRAYYRFNPLPARDLGQVEFFVPRSYGDVDQRIVAEGSREAMSAALRLLRDQALPTRMTPCECGCGPIANRTP